MGGGASRRISSQQLVEQHTQRIDVGGSGDGLTANLFGAGVAGRPAFTECGGKRSGGVETRGNSEIDHLYLPIGGNQYVRWLEITVHDQVLMRMLNGRT